MRSLLAALALMAAVAVAAPVHAGEPAAIAYPDPSLTTGAVRTTDAAEICATGTSQFRHWDRERTDLIFAHYHIAREDRIQYTLDHLVPLEIGGADVIENIWPEPRRSLAGEWDDTRKDQLAALVCSSQLDVAKAQRAVADDWVEAYGQYVLGQPAASSAPTQQLKENHND